MATYNGEKYLKEQIDSILAQTYMDWHLFIHDDGSTDSTYMILQEFSEKHPNHITLLDYPSQSGACANFMNLLERIDAHFYMFSDQDDVWIKEKIEIEMREMITLTDDGNKPVIVFTDLYVVNSYFQIISESFTRFSCIFPEYLKASFNKLGAANMITGCTMLFNKSAKTCIQHPYTSATMHDAWIALCVIKSGGIISYISIPTVYYRQHDGNSIGASDIKHNGFVYRITHIKKLYQENKKHYLMLSALGYGSIYKYILFKIKYKFYKVIKT